MTLVHNLVHALVHPKPQKFRRLGVFGPSLVRLVHETGQVVVLLVHPFRVDQWTSPEICRFLRVGLVQCGPSTEYYQKRYSEIALADTQN